MNSVSLAYLPFAFALAFAIFGGVMFGLPLTAILPDAGEPARGKSHMRWPWEAAILLLVAGVTCAMALYPSASPILLSAVSPVWLVAGVLMVVRWVLLVVTKAVGHGPSGARWTLAVISLAIPALLIQTVTVLLTGDGSWTSHWPLAVSLGLVTVLCSIALWSGYFYLPGRHVREVARRSYLAAAIAAAVALPLALVATPEVLEGRGLWSIGWPIALALALGIGLLMWPDRHRYFYASIALVTGIGLSLLWTLLPYYVRPIMTIQNASTNGLTQLMIAFGYILVAFVLAPAAVLIFDAIAGRARRA